MEKKVNSQNKKVNKNSTKKSVNLKLEMNKKNIIEEFKSFYTKNLKKLNIIMTIICIILYVGSFITNMMAVSGEVTLNSQVAPQSLKDQIEYMFFLDLIVVIAGITPYFYISIFGVSQAILIVNDMVLRHIYGISMTSTLFIGGFVQILGIAYCVAAGLYMCNLSTKKNKYYHQSDFNFSDIKRHVYEIKKDEKKLEEIEKQKVAKAKEMEKYNVKIPYKNMAIGVIISFVIQVVGILITKI